MARTDMPKMERHEDGGSIRLSFPSQGHPPEPSVSANRLGDIPLGRASRGHPLSQVKEMHFSIPHRAVLTNY